MEQLFVGIIAVVIGVILITSLATTINTNTNTASTKPLENVSQSAKALYGLYDLVWAALGLVFIVGGGFLVVTSFKPHKR